MATWWTKVVSRFRILRKWYILLPIVIVLLSPFILFAALLIEVRLTVYSFTKFEGRNVAELLQTKGQTSLVFEGENFTQELRDFLEKQCCFPPRNVRGVKAYVYPVPVRFAWAYAVFYVDSNDKIVGVEISGT